MPRTTDGRWMIPLLAVIFAACGKSPPPPFTDFRLRSEPVRVDASNAFEAYERAAAAAIDATAEYETRVSFTPGQKQRILGSIAPSLSLVARGTQRQAEFPFEAKHPFEPFENRRGWQMIARALVWRIESHVEANRDREALDQLLVATRFGFDLTGGDAADASLGYTLIDQARRAFLPAMVRLSASELGRLSKGVAAAISRRPPIQRMLDNERANMMQSVQFVQDAYQKGEFSVFRSELGNDIQPAVDYLEGMRSKDGQDRVRYFQAFAAEADRVADYYEDLGSRNAAQRRKLSELEFTGDRPWRRFAKVFFHASAPVFSMRDRTIARTRLLAMHAEIRRLIATQGAAPEKVPATLSSLNIDPYSGLEFAYRSARGQYRLFSVGEDGRDDGGETNDSFSSPDLTLETNSL